MSEQVEQGATPELLRHTVVTDGEDFMLAVPGATGRIFRTGFGDDRGAVTTWDLGGAKVALIDFGFPAVGEAEVVGESLLLATMLRTPSEGRWDGVPIEAGQTFVYPVGSAHQARDPSGLLFCLSVLPWGVFEEAALQLGFDPEGGTRQRAVAGGPLTAAVAPMASSSVTASQPLSPVSLMQDGLIESAVRTVCEGPSGDLVRTRPRRWEDADLVREVNDYLDRGRLWSVPVLSLCRHVAVSERRLQIAFQRRLGVSPMAFVRMRALQAAHRALREADPATGEVAVIARSFGFGHAGRFAQTYRSVYGEPPSRTLLRSG